MKRVVVENLRSAYNVGNIIRTADALGRGVVFVGYTARPDHKQVKKTSLGAEDSVPHLLFDTISEFFDHVDQVGGFAIAAELTEKSISLTDIHEKIYTITSSPERVDRRDNVFLIVGNEVTGVEKETLNRVPLIVHIPMLGTKESLNVGQAAAIIMREISKN